MTKVRLKLGIEILLFVGRIDEGVQANSILTILVINIHGHYIFSFFKAFGLERNQVIDECGLSLTFCVLDGGAVDVQFINLDASEVNGKGLWRYLVQSEFDLIFTEVDISSGKGKVYIVGYVGEEGRAILGIIKLDESVSLVRRILEHV